MVSITMVNQFCDSISQLFFCDGYAVPSDNQQTQFELYLKTDEGYKIILEENKLI